MRVFTFLTVGLLSVGLSVSVSSRVAEGAQLYLAGDLRGSFVSPELSGYLSDPTPGNPRAVISGDSDDRDLTFGLALGVTQPLAGWQLRRRSLKGWALRGEVEFDPEREYRVAAPGGPMSGNSEAAAHLKVRTLMANFWLDFPIHWKLSGHAGFGAGVTGAELSGAASGDLGSYRGDRREREFAFQVGAGLEYPVIEYLSVSVGYRYVDVGGFEVDLAGTGAAPGRLELDLSSHELLVGLRLSFDSFPSPFD